MIFDNDLSYWNWNAKYRYNNEHPLQTFIRTPKAVAMVNHTHYGADLTEVDVLADKFVKLILKLKKVRKEDRQSVTLHSTETGFDPLSELLYEDIHGDFFQPLGLKFTPGGRITANAGTEFGGATLLNCFIAPPVKSATVTYTQTHPILDELVVKYESEDTSDNLMNIFLTIGELAETLKSEGGYGISFGFIRPRSTMIDGVGIRHPGVVSYMEIWDKVSEIIVRGDGDGYEDNIKDVNAEGEDSPVLEKNQIRKGAMMAVLPIWHPDIEEFVRAKRTKGKLTKFNISVGVDDAFMNAVEFDLTYDLEFKGKVYKTIRARELYDLIMKSTYNFADPGVLFIDSMNKRNPILYLAPVSATNPCGEIGGSSHFDNKKKYAPYLQKWIDTFGEGEISGMSTVCLLGSHNLTMYVNEDRLFDFREYLKDVDTAALFLENINDIGNTPLPHYQRALTTVRQYGMGVNGLGSAMLMMGLRYGSPESIAFVEEISYQKQNRCWMQSALLAMERGPALGYTPAFLETEWFEKADLSDEIKDLIRKYGVRNLKVTTNPPLGNSSVVCNNVSNSGEPLSFMWYDRTTICDEWPKGLNLESLYLLFKKIDKAGEEVWVGEYDSRQFLYEPLNRGLCEIRQVYDYGYKWILDNFPDEVDADYMIDTNSLTVDNHLQMQAAMQRHVDQSISKTIIVPNDFPFEDFKDTYMQAWKLGLNGCTTYRVGTLGSVISQAESEDSPFKSKLDLLKECGAINEGTKITAEGIIINSVKLPDSYVMEEMVIKKREGNKYYMTFSFLPNDSEKRHPIAFWILSNSFKKGEYVSMRKAIKALYSLMLFQGISAVLVEQHEGKVGDDNWSAKLGKAISMCLRHNVDLLTIVEKLEGIEGDHISTTLTAVRKYLKGRIEDGTRTNKTCLGCGSFNVIYEAGCDKCLDCGSSGCN
jgi:ribonucleoside-diphosphate reductase alpha chain